MRDLFLILYKLPPWLLFLYTMAALAVWTLIICFLNKQELQQQDDGESKKDPLGRKISFSLNLIIMILGLAMILYMTYVRHTSSVHQFVLYPLRPLYGMKVSTDYWQVSVMNIVLYVPFACGLTFLIKPHPVRTTILICLCLSVVAEMLQYFGTSGVSEVDDVLFNTFGAVLGTLPFVVSKIIRENMYLN